MGCLRREVRRRFGFLACIVGVERRAVYKRKVGCLVENIKDEKRRPFFFLSLYGVILYLSWCHVKTLPW